MTRAAQRSGPPVVSIETRSSPSINDVLDDLMLATGYVSNAAALLNKTLGSEAMEAASACVEVTLDYAVTMLDRISEELRALHPDRCSAVLDADARRLGAEIAL